MCFYKIFLSFLCCLVATEALVGRCGHAEKQRSKVPTRDLHRSAPFSYMSAYARGGEWEQIRISVYYGNLNITEPLRVSLEDAIRGSVNWFQHTLKVRPVVSSWSLIYHDCLGIEFTGPINTDEFSTDFVLYVFADMEDNGMAGYSAFCQVDSDTNQPVVGLYYFNGRVHEKASDEQIFSTSVHEIMHAMVFSGHLYQYFTKPSGDLYTEAELFIEEEVRGYIVLKLALPTVTQKAREAFNCSSLNGVELERDGGAGSVGVHWEKRVMYSDFMVADSDVFDIIYSEISVALFQDSGWYQVSYKYTNPVQWGFHRGCEFISEKCIKAGKPLTSDFCAVIDSEDCDFTKLRKGYCDLFVHTQSLPWEYRYFSTPTLGGSDNYLDFCPVIKPYRNGDCRSPGTMKLRSGYGEQAGLTSRCFLWNDRVLNETRVSRSACYPLDCSDPTPSLTVGGQTVFCPKSGGEVTVPDQTGVIVCPAREEICRPPPCVNNCYGFGYCEEGTCVCDDGSERCTFEYAGGAVLGFCQGLLLVLVCC